MRNRIRKNETADRQPPAHVGSRSVPRRQRLSKIGVHLQIERAERGPLLLGQGSCGGDFSMDRPAVEYRDGHVDACGVFKGMNAQVVSPVAVRPRDAHDRRGGAPRGPQAVPGLLNLNPGPFHVRIPPFGGLDQVRFREGLEHRQRKISGNREFVAARYAHR